MASRRVVGIGLVLASAGCAAIVGLSDPGDAPGPEGGDSSTETGTGGEDASPPDAGLVTNIGYGTGRDGDVAVTDRKSVNLNAPLAENAAAGAMKLTLGRATNTTINPVKAGDVLLVVQSATPGVRPDAGVYALSADDIGAWDLVYVTAVNGDVVDLSVPLAHAFTAPGAQVVVVPQYKKVEIAPTGVIAGQRWDGSTGGVIAILATDAVMLNGSIDATNMGFRGGKATAITSPNGCNALDGLVDAGFAPRGEGFGSGDAGFGGRTGGRGNWANGGGGGDCHNSGGAGGGNGGRGGGGGDSFDNARPVGGMGGAALKLPAGFARLRFGGGGGAGETNGNTNGNGGPGGGVVFIRAPKVIGVGQIIARGGGGGGGNGNTEGAGGGGAGGTIYLDLAEPPVCARLGISGGGGGNIAPDASVGPGGGGGGGVLYVKDGFVSGDAGCPLEPNAGAAGSDGVAKRNAGPADGERDEPPYAGVVSKDLAR